MSNTEVRKAIDDSGFKYWQIADALGIAANTLTLWLRHPLPDDKKQKVMTAIETCKREAKENQRKEN